MLSTGMDDEDDDRHYCMRCKTTILGLDNYVKHRKEICGKRKYDVISSVASKTALSSISLEPTYSHGADVFFQSLELQSSVKKTISILTPPESSAKSISNIQKTDLNVVPSSSRDIPRMSPLVTNLQGEDWTIIQLDSNEDNQIPIINEIKETPSTSYNLSYNDYKDDESDEETEVTDDDDEDYVPTTGGKWKPPSNHTGGKWRPASPEHDDWELREDHANTEWKSILPGDAHDRDDDYDAPPPSHTKGKWIPGENEHKNQIMQNTVQNKGTIQYWCGVCNRRLASKAIYEKHLQSNLHKRKVLPENDLEYSGHLEKKTTKEKRSSKPSKYVNDTVYSKTRKKRSVVAVTINIKKTRNRKPYFVYCSGCKSKVRAYVMGKHLISHYHFRNATDIESREYQKLILDNIEEIVHQSPYQCSPCKFYSNWMCNFIQHWFSEEHGQVMSQIEGRYWCSFCKFECNVSNDMLEHISGAEHSEVISVINRSMPIIIRKRTVFKCNVCFNEFKYNIQLMKHCESVSHEKPYTVTDFYQEVNRCHLCGSKFKSTLSLAAHLKRKHKQKTFFCLTCSLTFETSKEAKSHRFTSEHRIRQKEKLRERGLLTEDIRKRCPYCAEKVILRNIIELKEHITNEHPTIKKKCPKCGEAFVLPQEVTRHVRKNACKAAENINPDLLASTVLWKCRYCSFKTDSQAECIFHEVLHMEPEMRANANNPKKVEARYSCPVCPKSFTKASLRLHIRQHTFERPFVCTLCKASFTRQGALSSHTAKEHGVKVNRKTKVKDNEEDSNKTAKKGSTSDSSRRPSWLVTKSNSLVQTKFCPHEDCHYIAASQAQLDIHQKSHEKAAKPHDCKLCKFKSDRATHLKRHMLCHARLKPYACPHCSFTCASLENLRKHVLNSERHAGLHLYSCPHCGATSDHAKVVRKHLVDKHPDLYDSKRAVIAVKNLLIWDTSKHHTT